MPLLKRERSKGRLVLTGVAAVVALASSTILARPPEMHGADRVLPALDTGVSLDQAGWLELFVNPDALDYLGLSLPVSDDGLLRVTLRPGKRPLQVQLGDNAPTAIGDGHLLADGLRFTREDGTVSPALRVVSGGDGLVLSFRDDHGREWARILQVMRSPDVAKDGFRYITANFAVGEALLAFAGKPAQGLSIANAGLQLPLETSDVPQVAKSEANPVWPGSPGTITDVLLDSIPIISTDMPGIETMRCRQVAGGGPCDGPGGTEGEVVITPEARLSNSDAVNASDVPWYRMFSEATSAYPDVGPKIDQHPYLIWNLYRLDPDGRIAQIGRSGAKHAFATANEYCTGYTPYGHILGPGCSDLYNVHSNECERFLGPRSEIIPATGQWGRCGSIQDPDCDGDSEPNITGFTCVAAYDSPARDKYSYRLRARESAIDINLHPESRWMMEAWYVVRDDENIHNTMGSREVFPAYSNPLSRWQMGSPGPFVLGSVLDRWLSTAAANESTHRAVADTAEGEVAVAVRVSRLGDGRFRYDYAVMNFDFARAQTDAMTEEPNLRITSSHGLDGVAVELASGATVEESLFGDGNSEAADDWAASAITGGWQWMAPATPDAELEWGQLRFFRLISSDWPGSGSMTLQVAGGGMPASYAVTVPSPDGSIHLFGDAFE